MFIKILLALLYIGVGLVGGYFLRQYMSECKINNATKTANSMVEDAIKEGERVKKEKLLEAKEEIHALRTELDKESRDRRNELQRLEKRVIFK